MNMLRYDMISYDIIWYDMIWYDMIWNAMLWYDVRSYHICCLTIDDLDASWIHSLPKRAVRQVSARTGKDGSLMEATDLQVEKHGSFDKILKPGYQKWTCIAAKKPIN